MSYRKGEVVLVLFPDSNLRTAKRRPALVIQAEGLVTNLPQTLVAMISSNMSRQGPLCRVGVAAASRMGREAGLLMDSVIMCDNIATVRFAEIDRVIGQITDLSSIDRAIRNTLRL